MFYQALLTTLLILTLTHLECHVTNAQEFYRSGEEFLDSEKNYLLRWNVSLPEKKIYFEVTAKTTGYVGFGISPTGGMKGGDIFVAGVYENVTEYKFDLHAIGNEKPILDKTLNWALTSASQNDSHTTIIFNRLLNTCDDEDYPITDATMRVIYAMGETDDLEFHGPSKGTKSMNFFLEDDSSFDPEKHDTFDIIAKSEMPPQDTTYWCTFHKVAPFSEKQHVVAFEPILEGELSLKHTHHFNLFKCIAPEGQNPDELFGPFVGKEGRHCYDLPENSDDFPTEHCRRHSLYVWSKGGVWTVFPSNVGFPVPDTLNQNEYYQMETHFDNPQNLSGLLIESGIRAYYTNNLREHDAGLLIVNHDISPSLTVPAGVQNFITSGHCSGACTEKEIPEDGITLFNNLFHSHLAGRKMKLRHFRGNMELPWIDADDHYDFDYQQSKPLSTNVKVERGDQLTVECTFDTSKNNDNKIVVGGLSTHEEMCEAILWYYPKTEFVYCGSAQDLTSHFQLFGVTNFTTKNAILPGGIPAYDIIEPKSLAGDYIESISFKFNWTQQFLEAYQKEKSIGEQGILCLGKELIFDGTVKYPENVVAFVPENECVPIGENSGSPLSLSIMMTMAMLVILQAFSMFFQ